jgi:ABC-2 type transport system ATP-binding protein
VPVIEVRDLVKTYDGRNVVDGVSFTVEQGEIFGIVGPNGAGKTTTVESVEGIRRPDRGSIRVLGLDPETDRDEITQRVGVQLQESRLPDKVRVGEVLDVYSSFYRNPADWRGLLERFGLEGKRTARYASLSGGQKQRLSVTLALLGSPEVAMLDELTTGLDPAARRSTWETVEQIRSAGVTVVLVTHYMDEAERLCDRIMVIDHGRVAAIDSPAGLIARAGPEHRITFTPSAVLPDSLLAELPDVATVDHEGPRLVVTGTGTVANSVMSLLAERGVVAEGLQIRQRSLEDAYLTLTSRDRGPDEPEPTAD